MSSPLARIVEANRAALAGTRILTVGFGPDIRDILDATETFTSDLLTATALGVEPRAWLEPGTPFDVAIVSMPKERARLAMTLAMVRAAIAPGATVAVVGHNKAGIKGAERTVGSMVGDVRIVDARAHHRLLVAKGSPEPASLADWRSQSEQLGLQVVSYPGVFSHEELDPGTRALLSVLPDPSGKRALDAGCGAGLIAASLAARGAAVHATDIDALAVEATRATLEANGLTGDTSIADLFVDGPFDLIVSNPPFHRGIRTTTATAQRLIADAPEHLTPRGELWLVVNRHLGHTARVAAAFGDVDIVAEDGRYLVLRAQKGNRT